MRIPIPVRPYFYVATEPKVNKHHKCWWHLRCCNRLNTTSMWCLWNNNLVLVSNSLIARFMGPTRGSFGADRTHVSPMLAPWTLLSGVISYNDTITYKVPWAVWYNGVQSDNTCWKTLLIKGTLTKKHIEFDIKNCGDGQVPLDTIKPADTSTHHWVPCMYHWTWGQTMWCLLYFYCVWLRKKWMCYNSTTW